jgi:hypothetical protein
MAAEKAKLEVGDSFKVNGEIFEVIHQSCQIDKNDHPYNFKYEIQLKSQVDAHKKKQEELAARANKEAADQAAAGPEEESA